MPSKMNRDTIGDISRRAAARYPRKKAILYKNMELTFSELEEQACRFANLMTGLGVRKGDRVAINSYNSHHYAISLLGLAKIGAVQVPVNFMLNAEEVDYVVTHSGARVFLVEDTLIPQMQSVPGLFGNITTWGAIPLGGGQLPAGFINIDTEMAKMLADDPDADIAAEDIVQIPYTSGTESRPKGAMLSHRSLMSQYFSCLIDGQYETGDISLHALPLFHCAQLHCFLMPMLYCGAENIILYRADPLEMMKTIQEHGVTHMFAPPTVWIGLLNHPEFKKFDLSSLRKAAYGASIMPVEIIKKLSETFPGLRLWNYYGQTEMGPVATILKPEDQITRPGSAGKPVANVETRLMEDDGTFTPDGQVGEIVHRSGQTMTGYLNDPEKTAEAFAFDWFHSGDLGRFDDDGYLYVVDRKKDMIKTGGENVASREVEEVIYQHAAVAEVAVIGIPDPKWIELVAAVVVPRAGSTVTEKELTEYCRQKLAGFKCPKRIMIVDRLPKNPSGKILKRELKEKFAGVN